MGAVRKKIVTDEAMRPVAVQIDYDDWARIEKALALAPSGPELSDLSRHEGHLDWPVDGLEYQQRIRGEW